MNTKTKARFTKDVANKKIIVVKDLDANIHEVWNAYTDSTQLDQWWAPKPWRAETKTMNFKEGGTWRYAMIGPKGERQWSMSTFETIDAPNKFTAVDNFTDESGKKTSDFPSSHWTNTFEKTNDGTRLRVELKFKSEADMKKLLDTGFEKGFEMGLENLEELLSK